MSDYSSMATLPDNSQKALAAAVQRARLVAAKIEKSSGNKRPLEDGSSEPSIKKLASLDGGYPQSQMSAAAAAASAAAAAAAARLAASNSQPGGAPPMGNNMADQINEYIKVPDNMVGLIIGRGGEQITRLQAESGCKIQMAPGSGDQPDRLCTLTGNREAIARARELVNQIVNHRGRENTSLGGGREDGGGLGGLGSGLPPQRPPNVGQNAMEEIMLPGPKVGLIIGKSGKTIKQLQEQTGAKMVVIQDGPNTEFEKPLRISGDPDKVEHAKQLVYDLLSEKEMMSNQRPQQFEDPYQQQDPGNGVGGNSVEVLVPKVAVGIVIGRKGEMIKRIQSESGARVQFHQEREDGPGDKRCYLQGKSHQVEQAKQMIEDLIASVNRRESEVRNGGGGSGGGGGGGMRGGGGGGRQRNGDRGEFGQQWQEQPEMRVTFTVDNQKCGLIIGRRGEVIKQINAQSGAHCELDRNIQNSDRNERTFYIKGHPDAVEHCKSIIMEKVGQPVNFMPEGYEGGMGGGGGGGGNGGGGGGEYGGGGGGGGGPPSWGYNPQWHPANHQQPQQQQVPVNPVTGQPDYSQQWIDYYRSLGLVREAEAIEQQAKQQQQPHQAPAAAAPTPAAAGGAGAGAGGTADYSAQWADYYRSIGKVKEAEAIEAQIKMKQGGGGAPQPQPSITPSGPAGGMAGMGGPSSMGGPHSMGGLSSMGGGASMAGANMGGPGSMGSMGGPGGPGSMGSGEGSPGPQGGFPYPYQPNPYQQYPYQQYQPDQQHH